MVRLVKRGNTRTHKVLAQKHAEHGRFCRIFHALPGNMHPGIPHARRDKQTAVTASAPQRQNQHVPFRLLHLVDLRAFQLFSQLSGQCADGYGIKRHITPPP